MYQSIRCHLETEIARAEAVVRSDNGKRKQHQPTVDYHKGQLVAFQKVMSWLDMHESRPPGPINLTRTLVIPWSTVTFLFFILVALMIV